MTLSPGARLGPYEILGPLGAGGMGEVYRARDPKLNRDVAIKILPEALAADPAALARFERKAQAVAALSHPNILSIHDFGVEQGAPYAVMELLEGQTLREHLRDGAGDRAGHGRLHGAGTGSRPGGRSPRGHLRAGGGALRTAGRAARVPGHHARRHDERDSERGPAGVDDDGDRTRRAGARPHHPAVPGQEPGRALPISARRGTASRSPSSRRASATPSRVDCRYRRATCSPSPRQARWRFPSGGGSTAGSARARWHTRRSSAVRTRRSSNTSAPPTGLPMGPRWRS